jgi:hypothetical protein
MYTQRNIVLLIKPKAFVIFANTNMRRNGNVHCKKRLAVFPSPAGMSPTKLSVAGIVKIVPRQGDFG